MRPILWHATRYAARTSAVGQRFASSQTTAKASGEVIQSLSPIALRDACKCSLCVDQSTKQRDFLFSNIPTNIEASVQPDSSDGCKVKWTNDIPGYDDHVSHFTTSQLESLGRLPRKDYQPITMLWDKNKYEKEHDSVTYDEYMNSQNGLAKALQRFRRHGLVFLTGVPSQAESVARIAERIAPLRNTFYGNTWDVRSVPQAKNVAYTSKYLGFHMDLLYMKESPGAQFLHCLENTSSGGESRFVDTFKAYDVLLSENPEHAAALRSIRIRYEYDNDGHYYTNTKPVVDFGHHEDLPQHRILGYAMSSTDKTFRSSRRLFRVYWSPPFVGSILERLGEPENVTLRKVEATKAFADLLERKDLVYETKMEEGTCVIFDNLRVVHARNAFDMNSGKRWLRGCYLDSQDVASKELSLKDAILSLKKGS